MPPSTPYDVPRSRKEGVAAGDFACRRVGVRFRPSLVIYCRHQTSVDLEG